jgi:hypothetical protein
MKPDFALDFRNEAITLLHRQEGGWALVGRVAMDDPDLDAALGYLRATALGLSPRGISAKLILPNDAILYTTLTGLPANRAQRAAMIAQGLVGRTPYRVDDLVYDWTDEGGDAHLAVIARETLVEAEGFATQHRFNPVSFAALPDAGGRFAGEVWFGATDLAQTLLARGEVVERDSNTAIAPTPLQSAPAQASSSDFEMGARAEMPEPEPEPEPELHPAPEPEPIAHASDLPNQAAAPTVDDEVIPDAPIVDLPPASQAMDADSAAIPPEVSDKPADPPPSFDAAMAELDAQDAARMDDEAPMALDVPLIEDDPATAQARHAPKAIDPDISAKGEGLLAAFAARRNAALTKAELATNTATRKEPVIAPPPNAVPVQEVAAPETAVAQPPIPPVAAAPKLGPAEAAGTLSKPIAPTLATPLAAPLTPVRPALLKPEPVVHVPAKAAAAARAQNIKSMPKAKTPPRIKPRIGLGWILTAALLLSLMAAAAMSSYLMAGFNQLMRGDTQLATATDLPDAAQNIRLQSPTLQNHAALAEAAQLPAEQTGIAAMQTADVAAAPQPISRADQTLTLSTRAPSPRPISPDLPSAAQTAPPLQSPIAPQIAVQPAAPVPQIAEETPVLAAASPDELPELSVPALTAPVIKVPVITGAPPIVPAPRPADIALQSQPFNADPALASARPAVRPSEIPAAVLAARAANPPPIADPALAAARPSARPTGAMAAARAARQATASASLLAGTQAAVNEALSAPAQDLGPLNVAISRVPSARPAGLAEQAAARAVAAAAPPIEAVVEAAPAAPVEAAALEAYEEPEDVTGAAPSRSVVARQATQRNVLVMNDVALVGIFGNQAGRYALVRQPNGRFRKLKVGDRFDGGQVSAITDTELRLAKGGQMVAMQMPRG